MEIEELDDLLMHLAEEREEPMLDWSEVFGNGHPVEIELGIGKGRFLIDAAQRNPQINYLGVEWAAKYLRIAQARSLKRRLENIRFVRVDARELVELFVPSESIQAYHVYFPDPWPKKRHHKRRLFNAEFLGEVERTLEADGLLWLATDHDEYFQVMEEVLDSDPRFVEVEVNWPEVRTNYEEKYITQGKIINRKVVQKARI